MSDPKAPRDALGNELRANDIVAIHPNQLLIGKVVAVKSGGLHTNQGVTPSLVRVVFDVGFSSVSGMPIAVLVRVISPQSEQVIDNILKT